MFIIYIPDDESESGAVYENLRIGSGGGGGGGGGQADGNSLYDVPRPIPKKIDMLYINKSFEDGVYDEPRRQPAKTTSHDNIMNSDEDLIEWDYDLPKETHTNTKLKLLSMKTRFCSRAAAIT